MRPARSDGQPRWPHFVVAFAYLMLALVVMAAFVVDPNGQVTTQVPNDQTWFQWLLSHGAHSLEHLSNPLFSDRQNMPDGVNLMANTSVLGVTIPLAPVTALFGARVAYVVWMVGACAGTAFATYWVLQRHLVRSRVAAAVGGAFAGFAPGVIHHANGQPNFVSNFLIPLIVAAVARLGLGGRWVRDGVLLGLLITWQLFINEEILLITALACAVGTVAYAFVEPGYARCRARGFLSGLAVAAGVATVLCAYPLWFQFAGPQTFTGMPHFGAWGEDPLAWVTFARDTVGGDQTVEDTVGTTEQNGWFGWPLVILTPFAAALLSRRTDAKVTCAVGMTFAVLSLGPVIRLGGVETGHPGPLFFITPATPLLNLLTPGRFAYAVIGALAVLLALAWDRLRAPSPAIWRTAIAGALLPLVPTPLPAQADPLPPRFIVAGTWREYLRPGGTMIPVPLPSGWTGRDTLSWSAWEHDFRVPEGYFLGPSATGTGFMGPAYGSRLTDLVYQTLDKGAPPPVTAEDIVAVEGEIERWNGSVVVTRVGYEPLHALVDALLGPGRRVQDVWLWDMRTAEPATTIVGPAR